MQTFKSNLPWQLKGTFEAKWLPLIFVFISVLLFSGCGKDKNAIEVTSVDAPPEPLESSPASTKNSVDRASRSQNRGMPSGESDKREQITESLQNDKARRGNSSLPLQWEAPGHWEPLETGNIRIAAWNISGRDSKDAEVTITSFPGNVGTALANLNRWSRQINGPQYGPEQLASLKQAWQVGEHEGYQMHLKGPEQSIMVGVVALKKRKWFIKLNGPNELVQAEKEAFHQFLSTFNSK